MKHALTILTNAAEAAETNAPKREAAADAYARDGEHERAENLRSQASLITTWLDDACSHCPECGWSDFLEHAVNNECPDCGGKVTPPNDDEPIEVETTHLD